MGCRVIQELRTAELVATISGLTCRVFQVQMCEALKRKPTSAFDVHVDTLANPNQSRRQPNSRYEILTQRLGNRRGSIAHAQFGLRLLQVTADGLLTEA